MSSFEIERFYLEIWLVFIWMLQNDPIRYSSNQWGCPFCQMIFKLRGNAKVHIMIHTGEKPFHCQYCTYSASRKDYVEKHMKTHKNWNREIDFWYNFSLIVYRMLQFPMARVSGVAHFAKWFSKSVAMRKSILWFILEKNHSVVNIALILPTEKNIWNLTLLTIIRIIWYIYHKNWNREIILISDSIFSLFAEYSNSLWPKSVGL